MTKLFIIGNGFDLAHDMNTKYSNFRNYIKKRCDIDESSIDNFYCEIPRPYMLPDGGEEYDEKSVGTAIIKVLDATEGSRWEKIETSLGYLDCDEFLYNGKNDYDPDDDKAFVHDMYNNEDNASDLCGALRLIPDYFQDWVRTIEIPRSYIVDFANLISPENDLFLNFNYTWTLEKIYNTQNVCHIHGTQDDEIFFGHGNDEDRTNEFQSNYFGADHELNMLQNELKKDTIRAYTNNIAFFHTIELAAKQNDFAIYSYGFSFSPVDRLYFEKIFKKIDTTNVQFYLDDFDTTKVVENRETLRNCGFKGEILTFHIRSEIKKSLFKETLFS